MSGYRVADMDPVERRFARAMHDLECESLADGHELEAHEPWTDSDREGEIAWPRYIEALRNRGLALVELAG